MEAVAVQPPPVFALKAKAALFLAIFVTGVGNSFVFAILPPIGREMGLHEVQVGGIITLSAFVFMLSASPWGGAAESVGRKRIILFGLWSFCVLTVLFALVIQFRLNGVLALVIAYPLLVALRSLFSACISGVFPSAQAYLADVTPPENRAAGMAFFGVSMGLGMIAGPAVAAAFAGVSLILPFYAVAALAIVAGLLVTAHIVETPRHPHVHGAAPRERVLDRSTLPFLIGSTIIMTNLSCLQQASGFYFQDKFGLSAAQTAQWVGFALMASATASVASQLIVVQRLGWSTRRLMRAGAPISCIGVALLIASDAYAGLVAGMALFGLGMGLFMPANLATLTLKVGPRRQGRIAGLNTSFQGMGFIIGPMIGSALYVVQPLLPYGVCLGLLVALILIAYGATRRVPGERP